MVLREVEIREVLPEYKRKKFIELKDKSKITVELKVDKESLCKVNIDGDDLISFLNPNIIEKFESLERCINDKFIVRKPSQYIFDGIRRKTGYQRGEPPGS